MKEYYIRFFRQNAEEDSLIVLPSFWKLLLWVLRESRSCVYFTVMVCERDG